MKKQIVVVDGGAGGLELVVKLASADVLSDVVPHAPELGSWVVLHASHHARRSYPQGDSGRTETALASLRGSLFIE